ncbi:MAG: pyridoxine 5'-phosphate synthase [Gammaproteobacteria bacterium]
MATLGVNIDHVATLREARGGVEPSVLSAAMAAIEGGADAITVHLREDRRHIQDHDVASLKEQINCRLNLEMAATNEMIGIAKSILPACCCVVPEKRQELTTEGGLDVIANQGQIRALVDALSDVGVEVSLFIDPDLRQIECARSCGAPTVEIHTGSYANVQGEARDQEFTRVARAIELAIDCGMQANAGHGLDYANVKRVVAIRGVAELNIGHSIISRAISVGLKQAVGEMKDLVSGAA